MRFNNPTVNLFDECPKLSLNHNLSTVLGGMARGEGGRRINLGIIVLLVFEPVFQNLPYAYTWPLKIWSHSYTRSSEMLTHSYITL